MLGGGACSSPAHCCPHRPRLPPLLPPAKYAASQKAQELADATREGAAAAGEAAKEYGEAAKEKVCCSGDS